MASIRIGVFGVWRGETYVRILSGEPDVEVVCLCDKNKERLDAMEKYVSCPRFTGFDEFLEYGKAHGMNAVFLANYFNQHTPFAVRCLDAGMDVISEC
ncbi:MAG: Gfo/Idh/MocA family oxidoreductase, partial [Clostridiales bacterium]|nr:Gfo/Idh/MocA family oxidoreductase [Clostridiales bacterium]